MREFLLHMLIEMIQSFNLFSEKIFVACRLCAKDCSRCLVYIGEQNTPRYMPSHSSVPRGRRLKINNHCNEEMNYGMHDTLMNDTGGWRTREKESRAEGIWD